jgi:hypothetical protein
MNVIIDTSSLLAFVKYYLPFDKGSVLKNLLKDKFESGELIIIDKVYYEIKGIAKGIIVEELEFLSNKSKHIKTESIFPNSKFFSMLEDNFCNKTIRKAKNISDVEFEQAKKQYLEDADAKMILYALEHLSDIEFIKPIIVTEETKYGNDGKLFKKIPDICEISGIPCCNLQTILKDYFKVDITFKI